jgi:sortase (surface protein transpeptidase)
MGYRAYIALLAVTSLVIVGSLLVLVARGEEQSSHRLSGPERIAFDAAVASASVAFPPTNEVEKAAPPVRVAIPAIGVVAPVTRLGLESDGTLEVPTSFTDAGWWSGGFRPGQTGPAVIVGHVDSADGPAVFANLRELTEGDVVHVFRADGSGIEFEIDRVEEHEKADFPTQGVYGETVFPELRLMTCGGDFDDSKGHYDRNVIVWASHRAA